ncbi:histidine kinase [Micromonospora sp. NPDC023814]|uniref:sensor histidine kinase n=1 Tax=Micromonospora sp. NPDC023814 TaxID=3154596 RepID=UPI0033E30243
MTERIVGPPGPPGLGGQLDQRLTRLGLTGRFARDCLLAAVLTVLTFGLAAAIVWVVAPADGLSFDPTRAWLIVGGCCGQAVTLCLRRVRPLLCLALVVGLQILVAALVPSDVTARMLAPLVVAYTVGTLWPVRAALLIAGTAAVVEVTGTVAAVGTAPDLVRVAVGHLASGGLTYLGAALIGGYVATQRRYVELMRLRTAEAVRAQQTKVAAAIAAERSRMARELHDVAAHHLSAMVVQASAVHGLIDRDPPAAKAGVASIRAQGKETLENMRLVVGVLRGRPGDSLPASAGDQDEGTVPVPGLAALDDLVRTARDLGASVELIREGEPLEVPPIADVALYRTVQECLSNARQHAPGAPVRVVLRFLARTVVLEVVNDPAPRRSESPARSSTGVGLIGMQERAQLIGARFASGPTAAGGWSVTVTVPTGPDVPRGRLSARVEEGAGPA